ncbi:DUF2190 family protein [Clostridium beijerinckii]|uniref:DUF2190 family protein n=1 Tax=Clostridium beijerinckii TaxID=1520 RepID=UPI00098C81A7|nr:DUF2190 family protein [Clostridium beijerinckii]MBA8937254.1 putative RecA/RadA family phage recombinase [Clostridium beijerinckii]MDG5852489.1 DUF2190 family protein [Clostridium beijerinckii]NRU40280.1 putative RecA/RadA family phage recombinase [Clostridium beijerinckii]NSA96443.1 putative RecA/RadA family phage recombinase [Clostridium beijerinckii]OOM60650.1 hypothetical protein CLOBI_29380 [Clostridium beijerinckii]
MAFKGQPVPTTLETIAGCKISDGKSVRVVSSEAVEDGHFYLINNFFGMAVQSAEAGEEVILSIEQAEYETEQINTEEAFAVGATIYYDDEHKRLTETEGTNRKVGRVTAAKDTNNVIWFILGPQV